MQLQQHPSSVFPAPCFAATMGKKGYEPEGDFLFQIEKLFGLAKPSMWSILSFFSSVKPLRC